MRRGMRYFLTMDFLRWEETFGSSLTLHRCRVDESGAHHPEWWNDEEWVEQKDVTYPERWNDPEEPWYGSKKRVEHKDLIAYCSGDEKAMKYYGYHEITEEEAMKFIVSHGGVSGKKSRKKK